MKTAKEHRIGIDVLPVMEAFPTTQGEGSFQGSRSWFIRLAGCDVGCFWCDVKESWPADAHPEEAVDDIVAAAVNDDSDICIITGGEPLMYPLEQLTARLQEAGLRTHIETSGAHPLSGTWDWFVLSPKKFKAPLPECAARADELKIVVFNKADLKWAEKWAAEVSDDCKLFLQPEWDKRDEMTPLILDYIKNNPQWRLSFQVHKHLQIP
ncbi:7-carboxy-7-deazaguanine synthase QueE [Chitinophagales bacterium]|nr:7-carboxy-7-deazaguanine synthase QueE [Chitinophagales bacterium]